MVSVNDDVKKKILPLDLSGGRRAARRAYGRRAGPRAPRAPRGGRRPGRRAGAAGRGPAARGDSAETGERGREIETEI